MDQTVKRLPTMWETRVQSLGRGNLLEKEMATHSSILAWKIPWMVEPGRLQSMGSQRVRHNWAASLLLSLYSKGLCLRPFFKTSVIGCLDNSALQFLLLKECFFACRLQVCKRGSFLFPFFFLNYFLLEYSCLKMLCSFLLYNKMNQRHIYVCVCVSRSVMSDSLRPHWL